MAKRKTHHERIEDLYAELDSLPRRGLGSVREHQEKCRINFEIWQLRERQCSNDPKVAAVYSREAREWSARLVHAQKASISDRIDELREMLEKQAEFSQELASLH